MKTKFKELPADVRTALCGINAHLNVVSAVLNDCVGIKDPNYTLKDQVKRSLELLSELLSDY